MNKSTFLNFIKKNNKLIISIFIIIVIILIIYFYYRENFTNNEENFTNTENPFDNNTEEGRFYSSVYEWTTCSDSYRGTYCRLVAKSDYYEWYSQYVTYTTHKLNKSLINSSSAWGVAKDENVNQWMIIKLKKITKIYNIVTQGRSDADQWVKKYKISYSTDTNENDDTKYLYITDSEPSTDKTKGKIFTGNTDKNTKIVNTINTPIEAKNIKIHPIEWQTYISMRADINYADDIQMDSTNSNYGTWTVPEGVTRAIFNIIGGNGGKTYYYNRWGGDGGKGAHITTTLNVVPGEIYKIFIGKNGNRTKGGQLKLNEDFSGGSTIVKYNQERGSGGGSASVIYKVVDNTNIPLIIAGGGGGGSYYYSGHIAGGSAGVDSLLTKTKDWETHQRNGDSTNNYRYAGGGGGYIGGKIRIYHGNANKSHAGASFVNHNYTDNNSEITIKNSSSNPEIYIKYIENNITTTTTLPTTTTTLPTTTTTLPTTTTTLPTTTTTLPTTTTTLPTTTTYFTNHHYYFTNHHYYFTNHHYYFTNYHYYFTNYHYTIIK